MIGTTFRQLEIFVDAADLGSFRACADRHGITQVSVSGHIRSLERAFGRRLFNRSSGTAPELTDDGRRLYRHAVACLQRMRRLMTEFGHVKQTHARRRLVVAAPGFAIVRLSSMLASFGRQHPEWQVEVQPNDRRVSAGAARSDRADLTFIACLEGAAPAESRLVWREPLGLFVGSQHPLAARRGPIRARDLATFPLILLPRQFMLRAVLDGVTALLGIARNPVALLTDNVSLVRRALIQTDALACLFADAPMNDAGRGALVQLDPDLTLPSVEIRLLTPRSAPMQRAARSLLDLTEGRPKGVLT